ncbi:MAG: hypothetical protein CMI63_16930 [Parvularcula sp.]|uniref:hypothetical protein n=1 Tax=Hyphococcus sp. TaxID=2038636 RepID=UPI000C5A7AFF|nr:hypothetical protein [Parvularcula sp.]
MDEEKHPPSPADIEAFTDGNLSESAAETVDAYMKRDLNALDRMFSVARLNSALRKAKLSAYRDERLAGRLSKLKKRA